MSESSTQSKAYRIISALISLSGRTGNRSPIVVGPITISTQLTIARIFLTIPICMAIASHYVSAALLLFGIAAITDALDGYLARLWNEQTFLGACLDPIADKVLMTSVFYVLAQYQSYIAIPMWFVSLLIAKEVLLVGATVYLYWNYDCVEIRPTYIGKFATILQVFFVVWFFVCYFFAWYDSLICKYGMYLLAMIIIISLLHYGWVGILSLYNQKKDVHGNNVQKDIL